jgi:hypothetical protein
MEDITMHANRSFGLAVTAIIIGVACAAPGAKAATKASGAETAIQAAAKQNRYVFATFYKKNDAASTKMLVAAKKLQAKHSGRASFVSADVGNAIHKELVSRYGVDRGPLPLTLVIAPNGAITGGYPNEIKKTDLSEDFVSTGMADVLKVLQSGKLAAICLQNSQTKHNKESFDAAEGLRSDTRLANLVVIVNIDPSDKAESKFMSVCKADTNASEAQLVVIVPPGKIVGKFNGATSKETVLASVIKSCSSGSCGPSGCP